MWISFAKTTDAVIMGRKVKTRRDWKLSHAQRFRVGQEVDFWDKNPRNQGKKMGIIILTRGPYRENTRKLVYPDDFIAEGFDYMTERDQNMDGMDPLSFFHQWQEQRIVLFVVEFKLHRLTQDGMRRRVELQTEGPDAVANAHP